MREKLLQKYGGLVFEDIDVEIDPDAEEGQQRPRFTISTDKMKWINRNGWFVMGEPENYNGTDDDELEPFEISERVLIPLLLATEQPKHLNVRVIKRPEDEDKEDSSDEESED